MTKTTAVLRKKAESLIEYFCDAKAMFPELFGVQNAMSDAVDVLSAYLAEHPADDEELPVTEAWLRSIGFDNWDDGLGLSFGDAVLDYCEDGSMGLFRYAATDDEESIGFPGRYKTRGDVRRLCKALGVELKS